MPIYEYRCADCGHQLEKLQRMNDEPLKDCPACGKAGLRRLVSAAGFRLKGAGWYETDFKQGNRRNVVDSGDSGSASGSGSKSGSGVASTAGESKGESKPAAESGSKPAEKQDSKPAPKAEPVSTQQKSV